MPAQITVAVVSWNTRDLLRACLDSLEEEARDGRIEVTVVDNASSDGSADLVRDEFAWAGLIASQENLGFGAAANLVANEAVTPWIALANADVSVEPGALDSLLAAAAVDPRAGALAPRLVLPDASTQHSVFSFPSLPRAIAAGLGLDRLSPRLGDHMLSVGKWDPDRPRRVPWAIAAFLLVRSEGWRAVGGFDPDQWMYAEDLDLGWRLRRAGFATRYVPEARVKHRSAAATSQAWGAGRTARWQRSTYAWLLRRRGVVRTRAIAAVNVASAAARYAALSPLAWVLPGRWRARRDTWRAWARLHTSGFAPARSLRAHR